MNPCAGTLAGQQEHADGKLLSKNCCLTPVWHLRVGSVDNCNVHFGLWRAFLFPERWTFDPVLCSSFFLANSENCDDLRR